MRTGWLVFVAAVAVLALAVLLMAGPASAHSFGAPADGVRIARGS